MNKAPFLLTSVWDLFVMMFVTNILWRMFTLWLMSPSYVLQTELILSLSAVLSKRRHYISTKIVKQELVPWIESIAIKELDKYYRPVCGQRGYGEWHCCSCGVTWFLWIWNAASGRTKERPVLDEQRTPLWQFQPRTIEFWLLHWSVSSRKVC